MSSLVFEDELYDMTSSVKPRLAEYFNAMYVAEEFPFSSYRTDLVFVQPDFSQIVARLEKFGHLQPILKRNRQRVYNWIRENGPITKDEFMKNGPYAKSYKWSLVIWLENRGYVESRETEGSLPDEWPISAQGDVLYTAVQIPYHSTIFAVELKQRNWEYAIEQANRAYQYADFWYVCMDSGGLPSEDEASDIAKKNGVGFLAADEQSIWEVDWDISASNRFDSDYERLYSGDMSGFGSKHRWRLNEESLAFIQEIARDETADTTLLDIINNISNYIE